MTGSDPAGKIAHFLTIKVQCMCGIAGLISLDGRQDSGLDSKLRAMSTLIAHRGPDDAGIWRASGENLGLVHRRLSIIDLSSQAHQPMHGQNKVIVFNGEIYNYQDLQNRLKDHWGFQSKSDTETILAAYDRYGLDCVDHLRGMFAFALWDGKSLFCARDRFGIKPFYYTIVDNQFIFASEAKALLPFQNSIETDETALSEYFTFQYPIGEHTLFKNIKQLLPGHAIKIENGKIKIWRYWDVSYTIDYDHSANYFEHRLKELLNDSIDIHLKSDVEIGSYVSGGIDSSLIGKLAVEHLGKPIHMFNGRFTYGSGYDESQYAQVVADESHSPLNVIDISSQDFADNIQKIIYHLDYPVAGPGSFPQYMVSKLARQFVKVVLGGQGGDEIFGGYARYVIAYFEQCIKAAIEGTYQNGNFVVTAESIIPNLGVLREYKPLIKQFWSKGLFESLDRRYLSLIDRSADFADEVDPSLLNRDTVTEQFLAIFNNAQNVGKESYFDKMTHFDFKCLLPGLLHVEDRVSMAHGLEARVPFLDHPLIEFVATIPADVKFKNGHMKHLLRNTWANVIPQPILNRRDKMGFPVPLNEWVSGELKPFIQDIFKTGANRHRPFVNYDRVLEGLNNSGKFSRKLWAFLSYELWHQNFHDKAADFKRMIKKQEEILLTH